MPISYIISVVSLRIISWALAPDQFAIVPVKKFGQMLDSSDQRCRPSARVGPSFVSFPRPDGVILIFELVLANED